MTSRAPVRFTLDVTLGSVLTIIIVAVMALEVALFYGAIGEKVDEAVDQQMKNRASIERLAGDMSDYKKFSYDQAVAISRDVAALQGEVERLKADIGALRRH